MKMDKIFKDRKLFLLVMIVATLLLVGGGVAYAYFTWRIVNDHGSSMIVKTAIWEVTFDTTNTIELLDANPGDVVSTTFTIENTGTGELNDVRVNMIHLENNFKVPSELKYKVTCESSLSRPCTAIDDYIELPDENSEMFAIPLLDAKEKLTFTITVMFEYKNTPQDYNQNCELAFALSVTTYDMISGNKDLLINKILASNGGDEEISRKKAPNFSDESSNLAYKELQPVHRSRSIDLPTGEFYASRTYSFDEKTGTYNLVDPVKIQYPTNNIYKYYYTCLKATTDGCKALYEIGDVVDTTMKNYTFYETEPTVSSNGVINQIFKDTDQDGDTYYYRGVANTNFVSYSGYLWRIVRINGDGSIRLVLDGVAKVDGFNTFKYNTNSSCSYGSVTSVAGAIECLKYTNSNAKTIVEKWFSKNVTGDSLNYLATSKFCNDYSYNTTNFGAYNRNVSLYKPSLMCTAPSGYANGTAETLTNLQVGLLTADEVAMAGGKNGYVNDYFYLGEKDRAWTMSPYSYSTNNSAALIFSYFNKMTNNSVSDSYAIRPVVNIKKDTIVSGKGTRNDPFIVDGKELYAISLNINNPNESEKITYDRNVTLYVRSGGTPTEMCFSNTNSSDSCSWLNYSESGQPWVLTDGYGTKIVYAFFKDENGDISNSISTAISYRPALASGEYLRFNNATTSATSTRTQDVTLYTKASNATKMCFSNTESSDNCTWLNYSESGVAWTLTSGYEEKTVYVYYKNVDDVITGPVSGKINYIEPVPIPTYLKFNNVTTSVPSTTSQNVTLYAKANYASQMCFSSTNSSSSCTWIAYHEGGNAWTLTSGYGAKTVYVFFKNSNGDIASTSQTITYEPTDKAVATATATGSAVTAKDGTTAYTTATLSGTCKIFNDSGTAKLYIDGVLKTTKAVTKVANDYSTVSISTTDSTVGKGKSVKVECVPSSGTMGEAVNTYNVAVYSGAEVCGVAEYNTCSNCSAFGSYTVCYDWGSCCSSGTCRSQSGTWMSGGKLVRCVNGKPDYCSSQGEQCNSGTGAVCGVASYNNCYHY